MPINRLLLIQEGSPLPSNCTYPNSMRDTFRKQSRHVCLRAWWIWDKSPRRTDLSWHKVVLLVCTCLSQKAGLHGDQLSSSSTHESMHVLEPPRYCPWQGVSAMRRLFHSRKLSIARGRTVSWVVFFPWEDQTRCLLSDKGQHSWSTLLVGSILKPLLCWMCRQRRHGIRSGDRTRVCHSLRPRLQHSASW